MADFNKIYTDSKLIVTNKTFAGLCFNNGKLISKSKYALDNHTITLLEDTSDSLSLYYNNGIAYTYEADTRLYQDNTIITLNNFAGTLVKSRMLLFLNGELELAENYEIINDTQIKILKKHTNDPSKIYKVFVYLSNIDFSRTTYKKTSSDSIILPVDQYQDVVLPCKYSLNKTLIFVNGEKVAFNKIEERKNDSITELVSGQYVSRTTDAVKLNIEEKQDEIISVEIVNLLDSRDDTRALHFVTRQGYLTYGPYDDFDNEIPNKYDVILQFSNQSKLVVDNLRSGFIIKEVNGIGELIVVDENFESTELKCLTITPFIYTNYNENEYYLTVPKTTDIINYLSEYDRKHTFLPEILSIFQRLLLDDIQDTIQRLRESRSINKVDSITINKLIGFLGFDLNIKTLNKKQRRELIEEINEFYRIAGTRNSYNLVNILQTNLKLIDIDQLFTIYNSKTESSSRKLYAYTSEVYTTGSGYDAGKDVYLRTVDSPVIHGLAKVTPEGNVSSFIPTTVEGYDYIENRVSDLETELNGGLINVKSIPVNYRYNSTVTGSGFNNGDLLKTADSKFQIKIPTSGGVDPVTGEILNYTLIPETGTSDISLSAVQLYLVNDQTYQVNVTTSRNNPNFNANDSVNFPFVAQYTTGGTTNTITLEPGEYVAVMSGGGGSGAATDSTSGSTNDGYAENGYSGQLVTSFFKLTETSTVYCTVGQGGGKVFGRGHGGRNAQENEGLISKGVGYENGGNGERVDASWFHSHAGQGGGSSAVYTKSRVTIKLGSIKIAGTRNTVLASANGGDGGCGASYDGLWVRGALGGKGGGGGTNYSNGGGAAGGLRNQNNDQFWSYEGSDGWIRLYRVLEKYTVTPVGNNLETIGDGTEFNTIGSNPEFNIRFTRDTSGNLITSFSPTTGFVINNDKYTLNPHNANDSGRLTITSTPIHWIYQGTLSAINTAYLLPEQRFVNENDPINDQFTFTIDTVNNNKYTYHISPDNGDREITVIDSAAIHQTGHNAKIKTNSTEITLETDKDRCYVDFYRKTELGAIPKKEYRINVTDYGYLNEGTPNSPVWWEPGQPDIDYGTIEINVDLEPDNNYGKITDKIKGEWVQWWEWDRNPNYYPTNHVALELKMPIDVNFDEYMNTFIEQIYNLASTVVYIHSIIESFYFGKDTTDSTNPKENAGACFGIATGAPVSNEIITVTSNPTIQYTQSNERTFSITPMAWKVVNGYDKFVPIDATVTLIASDQTVSGTGKQSITVPLNTTVNWTISMTGYDTKSGTREITKSAEKYISLN